MRHSTSNQKAKNMRRPMSKSNNNFKSKHKISKKKEAMVFGKKHNHRSAISNLLSEKKNKQRSHEKRKENTNKVYSKVKSKAKDNQEREDFLASDSEPDALTQLVSSLSKSSQSFSITSDEESDLSEDLENVDEKCEIPLDAIANSSDEESIDNFDSQVEETRDQSDVDNPMTNNCTHNTEESVSSICDPFEKHIQYELDNYLHGAVSSIPQKVEEFIEKWPVLGQLKIAIPKPVTTDNPTKKSIRIDDDVKYADEGTIPTRIEGVSNADWVKLSVKSQIQNKILKANLKHVQHSLNENDQLTPLQKELFSIMNNYQDIFYPERSFDNAEEIRFAYCLHTINHILKTRLKILHHNARMEKSGDVPEEFRDQGLVRPKALILVPFRNSALRVLEMMISILLEEGNSNVINKKRFYEEFNSGEIAMPSKNPKPEDYEKTFCGDTDDNFKIGISVTKKSLKLYVDFYSADIIITSPLGLRVIVGAEGQADRDYDFLASIELLVLDQTEVIFMQNWDHLLQVWDHLHLQPKESHGTNFARVRPWALSGQARFYRQTMVFCAHPLPQISALFSRKCYNYAGKVTVINPVRTGTICQIVLQMPQVFNRIECSSATGSIDVRFDFFIKRVLPQYKDSLMSHTLIYVPSYFDYVRIRNYFKKETVSFVQICEYSKEDKIARARDMFFHSSAHFLLYSERFHFFRRIRLKGIRHIIFYQPPTIPHFYSELCNLMQNMRQEEEGALSASIIYSRYDAAQLAAIVGSERASRMLTSDRAVHMFMTGD